MSMVRIKNKMNQSLNILVRDLETGSMKTKPLLKRQSFDVDSDRLDGSENNLKSLGYITITDL